MRGDLNVDLLMLPVLHAIERHVKDRAAITDIYNRAYEAVMNSVDVNAAEARAEALQTQLAAANEDAARLAKVHTYRDRVWGETCVYCGAPDAFAGVDTIKHSADCSITLHRARVGGAA